MGCTRQSQTCNSFNRLATAQPSPATCRHRLLVTVRTWAPGVPHTLGHRQPRCSAPARLTARIKMNWCQLLIQDCFIAFNFVSSPAWMSTAPVMDFYSKAAQQALAGPPAAAGQGWGRHGQRVVTCCGLRNPPVG